MKYGNIKPVTIENGLGVRVSFFTSGCRHHCKGCFSECTWDFNYGEEFTEQTLGEVMSMVGRSYISGLTVLGGEPLEPESQESVLNIVKTAKKLYPDKDIWMYTGFVIENILNKDSGARCSTNVAREIMQYIDTLVDGRFEEDKKDVSLRFRGSANQRIIKVKETLESFERGGNTVICDEKLMMIPQSVTDKMMGSNQETEDGQQVADNNSGCMNAKGVAMV